MKLKLDLQSPDLLLAVSPIHDRSRQLLIRSGTFVISLRRNPSHDSKSLVLRSLMQLIIQIFILGAPLSA